MRDTPTQEYQCCFCNKAIKNDDEASSVILTATNMVDWKAENKDPRHQSFYAHFHCLLLNWDSQHKWETEAIISTN